MCCQKFGNAWATLANRSFAVKHTFVKVHNIITKFAQIVVKFTHTL